MTNPRQTLVELADAQGWNPDTDCWRHECWHRNAAGENAETTVHTCRDGEQRLISGELVPDRDAVIAWLRDTVETHCQDTPYAKLALTLIGA